MRWSLSRRANARTEPSLNIFHRIADDLRNLVHGFGVLERLDIRFWIVDIILKQTNDALRNRQIA